MIQPSRDRPAFSSPAEAAEDGLSRNRNPSSSELFPGDVGGFSQGPTILANRAPVDLPDDFPGVVPEFRSRRKAEALPKLRSADAAKGFDWRAWRIGFDCGAVFILVFAGLVFAALRWL